jgi:alkylation response protein AidB-like acyl-CoA dehydrogenase
MNFEPNEEQRLLCESARKFFAGEFPLARLRQVEAQGLSAFLPVYRQMGELGYLGIGLAEEAGGSGGDWLDLTLFAEEAGRALVPTLQITSVVLGAQALIALDGAAHQKERTAALAAGTRVIAPAWLEHADAGREPARATRAVLRGDSVEIEGMMRFVQAFEAASELLVSVCDDGGNARFVLVPRETAGLAATPQRLSSLDVVHDLAFSRVSVSRECVLPGGWNAWLAVIDGAKTVAAAWAVGAARAALEMAVNYAKDRKQFGRPIGSFQAVQHRLADAAIVLEQASAMVRYAAWLRASAKDCAREAAMAKLVAGRAIRQVAHAATLTHGGYGFMEEFDIQLYFRRARLFEQLVEGPVAQRDIIAGEPSEDLLRVH